MSLEVSHNTMEEADVSGCSDTEANVCQVLFNPYSAEFVVGKMKIGVMYFHFLNQNRH